MGLGIPRHTAGENSSFESVSPSIVMHKVLCIEWSLPVAGSAWMSCTACLHGDGPGRPAGLLHTSELERSEQHLRVRQSSNVVC